MIRHSRLLSAIFLCSASAYVLWLARPELILVPGSPPTSDLGGHVVALRHLIEVSLPAGHLHDWSHEWFGGYPSFYFYFPLPALIIAALTIIMPLANAAKLIAVAAPALLPVCTWVLVRNAGFSRLHACGGALGAVTSLSLTTQYIRGGNVLSSVIGEYSYALGLCFAVLYLGRLAKTARGSHEIAALSLLLALSALTHLIPTLFAVLVSCAFFGTAHLRRQVVASWAIGFALSAFWSIPFLIRSPFMAEMTYAGSMNLSDLLPLPVLTILVFTLAAAVILRPRWTDLRVLVVLAAISLLVYLVPHGFFAQARALPLWYYAIYVLTGVGMAEGIRRHIGSRQLRLVFWAGGMTLLAGVSLAQAELIRGRSAVLLSSDRPDSEAYGALVSALRELPEGRVHWEWRSEPDHLLGSTIALARLPLLAPHLTTTFGLLLESGFMMHVYADLNAAIARGEDDAPAMMMRLLGIDYFAAFSPDVRAWASQRPTLLQPLVDSEQWTVWRVNARPPVEVLSHMPEPARPARRDDSMRAWRRQVEAEVIAGPNGVITDFGLAHRRIRFTTSSPGVPHLVRVAYFPNWRTVNAAGPFLVAPGFMVVIPHGQDVELRFERTWVELAGLLLSVLGAVGLFVFSNRRRSARLIKG